MTTFIKGMVQKNWSHFDCEDAWMRKKLWRTHNFGFKKLKEVLHKLVEVVEEKIIKEMESASKLLILHDAWSKASVNNVSLFVCCYTVKHKIYVNGKELEKGIPVMRLLACSPLPGIEDKDDPLLEDMK